MDKREFLKTSGTLVAGTLLSRLAPGQAKANPKDAPTTGHRTNWAGNITYSTEDLQTPATVAEVQQVVRSAGKLRALGSRHSFNRIADSKTEQVSLTHLMEMTLDEANKTATVGGGVNYGVLGPWLDGKGYAVANLASLPQVTVVGACSTATHGSGLHNGNLATQVVGLEIVNANGDLVELSREKIGDSFDGMVVALGALGVVTKTTLRVEPTFQVAQVVYQDLPMAELEHHMEDIMGAGYSVSLFTDWQKGRINQLWIKRRLPAHSKLPDPPAEFYNAKLATKKLHPLPGYDPTPCTEQENIPGPWYDRLPHFRMGFVPSGGHELQSEFFVPRERGYEALRAIESLRDHVTPHLLISEVRTVAPDNLWMSMAYQRPSMTFHFTWKPEWPAVRKVLPMIEEKLAPFGVRPHWAKLFTLSPSRFLPEYVKLSDYRALLQHYDPQGKFRNEFVNANIFGA